MAWVLTPALVALRDAFNRVAPNRDKTSDGSIGDQAHADSVSDHNPDETGAVPIHDADTVDEVHAIDVDEDLRAADARGAFTMMRAVRQLVEDHRTGREARLRYIIYERTIWSASWGWAAREYTGANPHDKHAHFSGSYDTAKERDTSPWNLGYVEDDMPTIQEFLAADVDPTDNSYSLGGSINVVRERTGHMGNVLLPAMLTEIAGLRAAVQTLAAAVASGTGVTPEALTQAVADAIEAKKQVLADAVVAEIAD